MNLEMDNPFPHHSTVVESLETSKEIDLPLNFFNASFQFKFPYYMLIKYLEASSESNLFLIAPVTSIVWEALEGHIHRLRHMFQSHFGPIN